MSVVSKKRLLGTMTSKGQTTVPKEVREVLGLSEGAQVEWKLEDGKATVTPRIRRAVDLAGALGKPPNGAHLAVEQMDDAVAEAVVERFLKAVRR